MLEIHRYYVGRTVIPYRSQGANAMGETLPSSHLPDRFLPQMTSWDATLHVIPAESLIWDAILAEESGPAASLWLMRVFGILLALWVISVMIMGLSHSYFGANCYQSITVSSLHRGSQWKLYLNYLALLPLHFMRSTDTSTGQNNQLYSPSEREFLTSKRRIHDDSVLNFLSVRRTSCSSHVSFKIVCSTHNLV